jgi:hypothetical protein
MVMATPVATHVATIRKAPGALCPGALGCWFVVCTCEKLWREAEAGAGMGVQLGRVGGPFGAPRALLSQSQLVASWVQLGDASPSFPLLVEAHV